MPTDNSDGELAKDAVPAQLARLPELAALWRYWRSKLKGRTVLARADFVPHEVAGLLPILTLTELTPEGRLRYRLAGGKVADAYGFEPTGKYLDEILSPDRLKVAHLHIETALARARPVFSRTQYVSPGGHTYVNSRLNIPLTDRAGVPNLVLAGHVIEWSHTLGGHFGDSGLIPHSDDFEVL